MCRFLFGQNNISSGIVPVKTGKDFTVSSYPMYVRNTANTSEIGTANNITELVSILNGDSGWNALGTWSNSGGLQCTGSPPAKVIAYNKVGQIYSTTSVSDFVIDTSGLTLTQNGSNIDVATASTNQWYRARLTGYGPTFLSNIRISFQMYYTSGDFSSSSFLRIGIDDDRILIADQVFIQDQQGGSGGVAGSSTTSGFIIPEAGKTYSVYLDLTEDVITYYINDGTNTQTRTLVAPGKEYTEHGHGEFFIEFNRDTVASLSNLKVECTAYKNIDFVGVGDSVMWGRGATTPSNSFYRQIVGSKPHTIYAHGDEGFASWSSSIFEMQQLAPAEVFVMGSYVNTPSGLSTFQTDYTAFINQLKAISSIQKIYHLASFPNNFGTDIRPFNSWKASTFNTGIDVWIDDYYGDLEEAGGTGFNLIDGYDWGGSHLDNVGQDIVSNAIIPYVNGI